MPPRQHRCWAIPAVVKLRQSVRPDARASGGLALDLHDATEVMAAQPERLAARTRAAISLLVQRQAVRWRELRIRVADDATFGPIISFGQGGTTADIAGRCRRPICRRSIWRWRMA